VPVSGTLAPAIDIRIGAPIGEVIDEVLVREGQAVSKGQVLARFKLSVVDAAAAGSEAALKVARADHERMQNLFAAGAVSQREVEAAEAQWRAAAAQHEYNRKRLDEAVVRAPISGVVTERMVEAGDRVGEGDPLFQLANTSELEFEATVPAVYVGSVRPGSPVRLSVSGYADVAVTGRVARVNAQADAATRQVKVYVRVPNPGSRLVGGLFASGAVVTRESRRALAIPGAALRDAGGGTWAMAVVGGQLARRDVEAGVRDDARDLVEVLSGLAEGDSVVVGPIEGLEPGQPVRVGAPTGGQE